MGEEGNVREKCWGGEMKGGRWREGRGDGEWGVNSTHQHIFLIYHFSSVASRSRPFLKWDGNQNLNSAPVPLKNGKKLNKNFKLSSLFTNCPGARTMVRIPGM